ncbi:MAG: 50S ribosomal protein L23 [Deltaproteobacteria bacterium]|nr:50S ribosomal protein L23 [Deltaproteobacteria bacterium]
MSNEKPGITEFGRIVEPIITEKTSYIGQSGNRFAFKVAKTASKTEIKDAVEKIFNVHVEDVNTINVLGKRKRTRRQVGRRASFKKAYVTLKEGETISVVEGL